MQHKLVTFIGGGNMAQAIVFGLLKRGYPADKIIVCDPNEICLRKKVCARQRIMLRQPCRRMWCCWR